MPPQVPAPDPPVNGIDCVLYLLETILTDELVVPVPSTVDGTLRAVYSVPPKNIKGTTPVAVLRGYAGEFVKNGTNGIIETDHTVILTIYATQYDLGSNKGDAELTARRYTVTVRDALNAHLMLGRDPVSAAPGPNTIGSSVFRLLTVRYRLGIQLYSGFAGPGQTTATDNQQYAACQILITVNEKEKVQQAP